MLNSVPLSVASPPRSDGKEYLQTKEDRAKLDGLCESPSVGEAALLLPVPRLPLLSLLPSPEVLHRQRRQPPA